MSERSIYLDHNATTPLHPKVVKALTEAMAVFGNPSSMHRFGAEAGHGLTAARDQVGAMLGVRAANEVIFTAGGSESDNLAIMGTLRSYPDKKHVVTSAVEHPAVLGLCKDMERRHGYEVDFIGVDGAGRLDMDALRDKVRDEVF